MKPEDFGATETAEDRRARAAARLSEQSRLWRAVGIALDKWGFGLFALTEGMSSTVDRTAVYPSPMLLLAHEWREAGMAPNRCETCGRPY